MPLSLSKPRILLIKLSSLGDVIHALPTLEALRSLYPRGHITWLVEDTNAPVLAGHPALDEVWPVPRPRLGNASFLANLQETFQAARRLRQQPFDLIIDLQGLLKSAFWVALARGGRKLGYDRTREFSYLALTERLAPFDPEAHAVWRYLNVARHLGAPAAPSRLPPGPESPRKFRSSDLSGNRAAPGGPAPRGPLAHQALARGSLGPPGRMAGEGKRLPGGYHRQPWRPDTGRGNYALAAEVPILNLAGRTSLAELAALLRNARLAVTTDTGPMHLACALGTPVVALFGPTAPWRTGPIGLGHVAVRLALPCSPCFSPPMP